MGHLADLVFVATYRTLWHLLTCNSSTGDNMVNHTDTPRLLRLHQILAPGGPIPVSRSTWWAKVRTGEYPKPIKISARITCWPEDSVQRLIDSFIDSGDKP